jgi:hypothetical protein
MFSFSVILTIRQGIRDMKQDYITCEISLERNLSALTTKQSGMLRMVIQSTYNFVPTGASG